jgi:folate-binding protein YgfZ
MNATWRDHLLTRNVVIHDDTVTNFGQPAAELAALRDGTVLCDLSHSGLIEFAGGDAEGFLQGQLSCDVRQASPGQALYGGYCSPKGRLLATFLLWRSEASFYMQLPAALREPIQKRLGMFVLRSRVKLSDASDALIRLGLAGPGAPAAVQEILGRSPSGRLAVADAEGITVIRLSDQRFELVSSPERAVSLWDALAERATPAGAAAWEWHEIREGIPLVLPLNQDQFVPQMANLELMGGVSFQKGCYPGQEIVARTHYLGRLKRRMYLAHLESETAPAPGDEVYAPDTPGQAVGTIVRAAPAPEGGFDLLAVAQMSSAAAGNLSWKSPGGPVLRLLPPPYPL